MSTVDGVHIPLLVLPVLLLLVVVDGVVAADESNDIRRPTGGFAMEPLAAGS